MLVGFRMARYPPGHSRFRASSFFLFSILRWIRSHKAKTVVVIVQQAARYITISMVVAPCLSKGASPAGTAEHCQSALYQTYVRYSGIEGFITESARRRPLFRRPIPTQNRRKFLRRFCVGFFRRLAALNADDTKAGKAPHSIERFYGADCQNENANYNLLSISHFSFFCHFAK